MKRRIGFNTEATEGAEFTDLPDGVGAEELKRGGDTPRGGLGCVANTGLRNSRFRKCGNRWTYGRIFGCVAGKGLREEEVGR